MMASRAAAPAPRLCPTTTSWYSWGTENRVGSRITGWPVTGQGNKHERQSHRSDAECLAQDSIVDQSSVNVSRGLRNSLKHRQAAQ